MIAVNVYLDCRRLLADGSAPVRVSLTQGRRVRYVATGVSVEPGVWDRRLRRVSARHPLHRELNMAIESRRLDIERRLLQAELDRGGGELSLAEAVALVNPSAAELRRQRESVGSVMRRWRDTKRGRTWEVYDTTLRVLGRYCDPDVLRFEDVDVAWLAAWDNAMEATSPRANARAVHLRNLRTVFNFAIDEGVTTNYPFRRFRIRTERTAKRALQVDVLRRLVSWPVEEYARQYRDFFLLSFLLRGLSAVDLIGARWSDVHDGRLEINRSKTGSLLSIRIEPEAWAIIERYRGREHLLDIAERVRDHRNYVKMCNKALRRIGEVRRVGRGGRKVVEPVLPEGVSTYWARHSWATIAASLDIPVDTIGAGLGHAEHSVTGIYVDFDRGKVDEANRRVIDWVLYGTK